MMITRKSSHHRSRGLLLYAGGRNGREWYVEAVVRVLIDVGGRVSVLQRVVFDVAKNQKPYGAESRRTSREQL